MSDRLCTDCGTALSFDDTLCVTCQVRQQAPPSADRVKTQPSSVGFKLGMLIGILGVLWLAGYLGWVGYNGSSWLAWIGAVVLLVIALVMVVGMFLHSAPCPACGKNVYEIAEGSHDRCTHCKTYLLGNGKEIWLMPDDFVAKEPSFETELPVSFAWPPGCCVCGAPAVVTYPAKYEESHTGRNLALGAAGLAVGALVVRTGGGSSYSVDVPHCRSHIDGAGLTKPTLEEVHILFRSWAYYRQFRELNGQTEK